VQCGKWKELPGAGNLHFPLVEDPQHSVLWVLKTDKIQHLFEDKCSQTHTCAGRIMGIQSHVRDNISGVLWLWGENMGMPILVTVGGGQLTQRNGLQNESFVITKASPCALLVSVLA
jgi:hypothetical protein